MQTNGTGGDPNVAAEAAEANPVLPGDGNLVDVASYARGREVVGTTVFIDRPRWVQIWTLEGGERILLLGRGQHLLHCESSLETLESAENRALNWLTEPPEQPP